MWWMCRPCGCGGISKSTFATDDLAANARRESSTRTPSSPSVAGSARNHSGSSPTLDERAERHVAGDAAERIEDRDAHQCQNRYDAPLPVLNTSTSASRGIRPAATSCSRHGERAAAFRRGVDTARARQLERRRANRVLAHRVRVALALVQRAQDEPIAERAGHAQSARVRRRILPRRRVIARRPRTRARSARSRRPARRPCAAARCPSAASRRRAFRRTPSTCRSGPCRRPSDR